MYKFGLVVFLGIAVCLFDTQQVRAVDEYDQEPINYHSAEINDVIVDLQKKINDGTVVLEHDEKNGYLRSVLKHLNVPVSSQVLVFSKTSLQQAHISPRQPRAMYFNDDVYIGWVQNSDLMEISSVDPKKGAIFYSLEHHKKTKPLFVRHTGRCLLCHGSSHTRNVPGHLVRSVYPDTSGMPLFGAGTFLTDHSSPLKERWGGWYVTGTHGKQTHMGNMLVRDKYRPDQFDAAAGANVTDLSDYFRTEKYPTGYSDIVALMVLEHQSQMHNKLTLSNYQGQLALRDQKILNKLDKIPAEEERASTKRRFEHAAEAVVKYMLFTDEIKLTDTVRGTSGYTKDFESLGPFDRQGRTLRKLDLKTRLFKYPCSFLIYSKGFEGIPQNVKVRVYRRLFEILTGEDQSEEYDHLTQADRKNIYEILRDTKPDLPKYWK